VVALSMCVLAAFTPPTHVPRMDIDELETETLRCLHLAATAASLDDANELRARAQRLNDVAKDVKWHAPSILGSQPPAPNVLTAHLGTPHEQLQRYAHPRQ
jgi:hypothetical protein